MASRSVSLTSTFMLLAAGGAAACDSYHREGFYCADGNGVIVDESYCDSGYHGGVVPFFIWHSPSYRAGYPIGYRLPAGGSRFAYNDTAARQRFGLPTTGRIGNGTIKSNVVGKGGSAHTASKSGG